MNAVQERQAKVQRLDGETPKGEIVPVKKPVEKTYSKTQSQRKAGRRRQHGVTDGHAPNGQSWSEVFMEADAWETAGTYAGRADRSHRDAPKPWPALPPPEGNVGEHKDWRLTALGLTALGLICIYLVG